MFKYLKPEREQEYSQQMVTTLIGLVTENVKFVNEQVTAVQFMEHIRMRPSVMVDPRPEDKRKDFEPVPDIASGFGTLATAQTRTDEQVRYYNIMNKMDRVPVYRHSGILEENAASKKDFEEKRNASFVTTKKKDQDD